MILALLLFSQIGFASEIGPTPFPVFLKEGFSTILEFEEAPTQIVLGDPNLFQVEKLKTSIVVKPLSTYASTNMFVYFKNKPTRLFILNCTEENEPTLYKKFASLIPPKVSVSAGIGSSGLNKYQGSKSELRKAQLQRIELDKKKDYLTIEFFLIADSKSKIIPDWNKIRLKHKSKYISPVKLWSERKEVLKDSRVKARLVFAKPNLPADLRSVSILVPVKDSQTPFTISLSGAKL